MADHSIDNVIELTRQLVQIPGEAGKESEIAHFLIEYLPSVGFENSVQDPFGNVIARRQGRETGKTLLLDAHIDTVGIPPGESWNHQPYSGDLVDGRLFGQGTSDMKGSLAAMITAIARLEPAQFKGQVVLSASVMEEVLEGAALKCIMEAVWPDFVIIGEASELKLIRAGRGRAELKIETTGRPAHTSSPQVGINAVEAMVPVLQGIARLSHPTHPVAGKALMALSDIISEPYPGHSVIPSRCLATYDRRLIPGETLESVLTPLQSLKTIPGARLDIHLAQGSYETYTGQRLEMEKWFSPWILPVDHPFLKKAAAGLQAAGLPVAFGAYQFCTNAAYSMGTAGVPTLGFGPSSEGMAHTDDEYVEVEQLMSAVRGFQSIIEAVLD